MNREFGHPSPQETQFNVPGREKRASTQHDVQEALELANRQTDKNLLILVEYIRDIVREGSPSAMDALDPDSINNRKRLPPHAREKLRKAWEVIDKEMGI